MKKGFRGLLVCSAICAPFLTAAVFAFGGEPFFYENPRAIIITHPSPDARVTSFSLISFLGACDSGFPLYVNGGEVRTTANGFFTFRAELEPGENVFVFTNGENAETVTVTRRPPDPPPPDEITMYEVAVYGSTEYDDISRFDDFNDDLYMRAPLAKGTVFRLAGERGDCYILEDGSYVFKDNVYMLNRAVPEIVISKAETYEENDSVRLSVEMNENALYDVAVQGDKAVVTVYAAKKQTYELQFEQPPAGYVARFTETGLEIAFRRPPALLSKAVVLIDAGHGGSDPGAPGPPGNYGAAEKDFNLYVADKARRYLESRGVNVIFVRNADEDFPVRQRAELFKERPDVSVCVHANSAPLNADFYEKSGPLMFYTLDTSEKAAESVLRHIAAEMSVDYTPPIKQNFLMTRYAGCPAMLFEMGFLCNPDEYERLLRVRYLDLIGTALGEAVEMYLLTTAADEPPGETESIAFTEEEPGETESAALTEEEPGGYVTDSRAPIIVCVVLFGALLIAIEPKLIND